MPLSAIFNTVHLCLSLHHWRRVPKWMALFCVGLPLCNPSCLLGVNVTFPKQTLTLSLADLKLSHFSSLPQRIEISNEEDLSH